MWYTQDFYNILWKPYIAGEGWVESRLPKIAALPRCRRRPSLPQRWRSTSPSSWPDCLQIPASSSLPEQMSATDLTASATVTISKKIIEYENSINFQSFNDCHTFRFQIINNRFNFFCLHFISFVLQEYQEYPLRLGFQEGCFPALWMFTFTGLAATPGQK